MKKSENLLYKFTDVQIFKLIGLVKDCDAIYNSGSRDHHNRAYLEEVWRKIDLNLGKPPGVAKERWQQLRIQFRSLADGSKTRSTQWKFYKEMEFLRPFLRSQNPNNTLNVCIKRALEKYEQENGVKLPAEEQNVDDPSDDNGGDLIYMSDTAEDEENDVEDTAETDEYLYEFFDELPESEEYIGEGESPKIECVTSSNDDPKDSVDEIIEPNPKRIKLPDTKVVSHQPVNIKLQSTAPPVTTIERNDVASASPSCLCSNDPDVIFLRSLLDDMKSMTRRKKGLFKIKIQQAIQDILYPDDDDE